MLGWLCMLQAKLQQHPGLVGQQPFAVSQDEEWIGDAWKCLSHIGLEHVKWWPRSQLQRGCPGLP